MDSEHIIKSILEKVIMKGWIPRKDIGNGFQWSYLQGRFYMKAPVWDFKQGKMMEEVSIISIESILFDHSFARILWGDEYLSRISELAVSDKRIEYLNQFIENGLSTLIP